jgi:hypothetical protein
MRLVVLGFLMILSATHARAQAPGVGPAFTLPHSKIVLDLLEIDAGRLSVRGHTALAHQKMTLDGRFFATSDGKKAFGLDIVYLPVDCVVDLKTSLGTDAAVVGNCGAKGPAGKVGPAGPRGPQGAAGLGTVSTAQNIQSIQVVSPDSAREVTASCKAGNIAIGGGFNIFQNNSGFIVTSNGPSIGSQSDWTTRFYCAAGNCIAGVTVFVGCAGPN